MAQEGESEKYSLTLKLFELGARALQNVDLIRSADIQMREIPRLTKETIHLGALDEDNIVYIHKIDSMNNLRMYSRIGCLIRCTAPRLVRYCWHGAISMK